MAKTSGALSGKQEMVLCSFFYGKGRPRRTSWKTMRRLEQFGFLRFDAQAVCINGLYFADYRVTKSGREFLEARSYHKQNAWLWTGDARP